jgi:hypothetical protein
MIWLEIHGAHMEHEASLIVPAIAASPAAKPASFTETVSQLAAQRAEISEFVGRVTFHLLVRPRPPAAAALDPRSPPHPVSCC